MNLEWEYYDPWVVELSNLRERLVGKRVLSVENGYDFSRLVLNDGTVLALYMTDQDCCAAADGSWVIQPDALDAIITDVQIGDERTHVDDGMQTNYATITILHNQNPIALAECWANNGNGGFYCSTLTLDVTHKLGRTKHDFQVKVVSS